MPASKLLIDSNPLSLELILSNIILFPSRSALISSPNNAKLFNLSLTIISISSRAIFNFLIVTSSRSVTLNSSLSILLFKSPSSLFSKLDKTPLTASISAIFPEIKFSKSLCTFLKETISSFNFAKSRALKSNSRTSCSVVASLPKIFVFASCKFSNDFSIRELSNLCCKSATDLTKFTNSFPSA